MSQGDMIIGVDLAKDRDTTVFAVRKGARIMMTAGNNIAAQIDPLWINGFNANRKPDREALAMIFETIAKAHGATVERRDEPAKPGWSRACVVLSIKLNGVGVSLDVDNLFGGVRSLCSWHNDYTGGKKVQDFSARFAVAVGDIPTISGGRLHHKATSCGEDWYSLAMFLDAGLLLAARGEAFEPSAS